MSFRRLTMFRAVTPSPRPIAALAAFALCTAPQVLSAQGAQKYGVQIAALTTSIGIGRNATTSGGFGLEPQFRFNRLAASEDRGVLSLGIGAQWTAHSAGREELTITGLFVEPRWVMPVTSPRFAPYLSGRLGYLQQSNNFGTSSSGPGFGAGAGLGIKLGRYTNLDLGVALVRQRFGDFRYSDGEPATFNPFTTYAAKIGVSRGFPR